MVKQLCLGRSNQHDSCVCLRLRVRVPQREVTLTAKSMKRIDESKLLKALLVAMSDGEHDALGFQSHAKSLVVL